MEQRIILASASPRRIELMSLITDNFSVIKSSFDESTISQDMDIVQSVKYSSLMKAQDVFCESPGSIVIGADTVVAVNDEMLGKPTDDENAFCMLKKLSGRSHMVYTGLTIVSRQARICTHATTEVFFDEISDESIKKYIATGEPCDKAGAYAIQGKGSIFIKGIRGDFFNVVGLPVNMLGAILCEIGVKVI